MENPMDGRNVTARIDSFCGYCKQEVFSNDKYCRHCGAKLIADTDYDKMDTWAKQYATESE